jgi:UDP-3-O-acyl-N-acetylglucosamine deacetylase
MKVQRFTLAKPAIFEGLGLHSGVPVRVKVEAGDQGLRFHYGQDSWRATPDNVSDTRRCTRLGEISTIEHLMSALAGLEITDAEIVVTQPELPAMDGSAKPFWDGLQASGKASLGETEGPDLFNRVFMPMADANIAISTGTGHWSYDFLTGDRWPGEQRFETEDVVSNYGDRIAPARTFGFEEELPMIAAAGLAKGLDENSALVLGKHGYLNAARFPDEPVLHKILDCIGDLYLAGIPIRQLNVSASRTGHTANVAAAALLAASIKG